MQVTSAYQAYYVGLIARGRILSSHSVEGADPKPAHILYDTNTLLSIFDIVNKPKMDENS